MISSKIAHIGALCVALALAAPAAAQSIGGSGGGGGGGGIGGGGGGGSSPSLGGAGVSVGETSGISSGQAAATAGSSTINSINVDNVARSGDYGATTGLGSSAMGATDGTDDGFRSTAGTGPDALYNMPRPRIGVQLNQIRDALAAGPSATPKPDGS